MDWAQQARRLFWSEYVWLPPNTTWSVYDRTDGQVQYARFEHLYYALPTALLLLCVRFTLER